MFNSCLNIHLKAFEQNSGFNTLCSYPGHSFGEKEQVYSALKKPPSRFLLVERFSPLSTLKRVLIQTTNLDACMSPYTSK